MQSNKKLEEIKRNLPLGGKLLIAKRLRITSKTVDNILNGRRAQFKNVVSVIKEAETIIAEYKELTGT